MTTSDNRQLIRLRLICVEPPGIGNAAVEFGLQDRKGGLEPGKGQSDGSVVYDFTAEASYNPTTDKPRFAGPFIHGTPAAPFLYLSLRQSVPGSPWLRRLKVSLASITWAQVEQAASKQHILTVHVAGTGSGTVPLLNGGWTNSEVNHD